MAIQQKHRSMVQCLSQERLSLALPSIMSAFVLYEEGTWLKQVTFIWFWDSRRLIKLTPTLWFGVIACKEWYTPRISCYISLGCFLILLSLYIIHGIIRPSSRLVSFPLSSSRLHGDPSAVVSTDELHWSLRLFAFLWFCRCSQSWSSGMVSSSELIKRVFLMNLGSCCCEMFSVLKN